MTSVIYYLELALVASGVIAWLTVLWTGRGAAWLLTPGRLPFWPIRSSDFLLFLGMIVGCLILGPALSAQAFAVEIGDPVPPRTMLIQGFALHLSGLLACLAFRFHPAGRATPGPTPRARAIKTGLIAFVFVVPVVTAVSLGWQALLDWTGWSPEPQDIVKMLGEIDSPVVLGLFLVLTVVLAPVTEELVFRATLFRFLDMHLPTPWAALSTSLVFASFHQNLAAFAPLTALGVVLCLVYRNTGRVITPVVLHAVFNFNTLIYTVVVAGQP